MTSEMSGRSETVVTASCLALGTKLSALLSGSAKRVRLTLRRAWASLVAWLYSICPAASSPATLTCQSFFAKRLAVRLRLRNSLSDQRAPPISASTMEMRSTADSLAAVLPLPGFAGLSS